MTANVSTFSQRISIGQAGQEELADLLRSCGFRVFSIGQETYLDPDTHALIRFDLGDPMVRAVRHAPDLLAYRRGFPLAYWDAKVNTTPNTPNFTIEKDSYSELMARSEKGERVVVAFKDTDQLWHANFVQHLHVTGDLSNRRSESRGSHTPFLLIRKSSAIPFNRFLTTTTPTGIWPTT